MHDIFAREPDPLDAMLAPPSLPPDTGVLRQSVYVQTRRVLRRRLRVRRFAFAAALAASFLIGLLVMRITLPPRSESKETPRPEVAVKPPEENRTPDNPPPPDDSALALELRAFDSIDRRGERYRQAGDRYMEEESDPQSALRCYSNALDHETNPTVSTDDNWLLMALKDARNKEKYHAKNGG